MSFLVVQSCLFFIVFCAWQVGTYTPLIFLLSCFEVVHILLFRLCHSLDCFADTDGAEYPYQLTVYPKITALSTQASGSNGGQVLTITGSGFNQDNCSLNTVALQGSVCAVQPGCTQTSLSCVVGAAPSTPLGTGPFAATRGLLHRIYWNSANSDLNSFITNRNYPNNASITRLQGEGTVGYCVNCADYYGQQMEGFFVPKTTAYHKFYISSDDASDLHLSTSNRPSGLTRIAYCSWYLANYWSNPSTQISAPILLQAGQPYFLRARQSEGGGGDFLNIAVRVMNPPARSPVELAMHSVHERQTISITSAVRREIQRVNLTGASGQFMFYIDQFGPRSVVVNVGETNTGRLANAIARIMTPCGNIGVTRRVFNAGALITYDITINCPTTTLYPQIKVDATGMTGTTSWQRVQTASNPVRGTFQVSALPISDASNVVYL